MWDDEHLDIYLPKLPNALNALSNNHRSKGVRSPQKALKVSKEITIT